MTGVSYGVVQILPSLVSGGVERGAAEVARALVADGRESVVVSAGGPIAERIEKEGSRHVTLPVDSRSPLSMYRNVAPIKQAIASVSHPIVHIRSRAPGWSGYFAASSLNVPLVSTFHGAYGHKGFAKRLYNSVMTRGERVIVASRYMRRHVLDVYPNTPQNRVVLIPRGVDMAQFSAGPDDEQAVKDLKYRWSIQEGQFVILLPGRVSEWKGHHVFLHALSLMTQKSGWVAIVLGDADKHPDYMKRLRSLAWRLGVEDRIRWIDHTQDVATFYKAADLIVNCSIKPEAFGRTLIEAQALGKPALASGHGGALDTVVHGETGKLVPPNNAQALAEGLQELMFAPAEVRRRMGEEAAKTVREYFTVDRMTSATLAVYASVAEARYGRA
ncbi:MAG: glycosyltransferase family 4 protein [Rickettsiales bacterium]